MRLSFCYSLSTFFSLSGKKAFKRILSLRIIQKSLQGKKSPKMNFRVQYLITDPIHKLRLHIHVYPFHLQHVPINIDPDANMRYLSNLQREPQK
jgi:hypothetical protein